MNEVTYARDLLISIQNNLEAVVKSKTDSFSAMLQAWFIKYIVSISTGKLTIRILEFLKLIIK